MMNLLVRVGYLFQMQALYYSYVYPNIIQPSHQWIPDQAAYATFLQDLEQRTYEKSSANNVTDTKQDAIELEEIEYPNTKLAKAYLKKKEKELKIFEDSEKFENAHIEIISWFTLHSESLTEGDSNHPHAIDTAVAIEKLHEAPPKGSVHPGIFGYSSWDVVMHVMDTGDKGYITRVDQGKFWEKWGIHNAYLKNRKPKRISSLASLAGEVLNSIMNVAEEGLLRDPNNAKRICSLSTKYVGLLDLEMEQADKDFLYELGKRDTIAWLSERASDMAE